VPYVPPPSPTAPLQLQLEKHTFETLARHQRQRLDPPREGPITWSNPRLSLERERGANGELEA